MHQITSLCERAQSLQQDAWANTQTKLKKNISIENTLIFRPHLCQIASRLHYDAYIFYM